MTVMYAGKMTHRPLRDSQQKISRRIERCSNLLHDAIEQENREPIIMLHTRESRKILVKVCSSISPSAPKIHHTA
jgi:hypothetical protein